MLIEETYSINIGSLLLASYEFAFSQIGREGSQQVHYKDYKQAVVSNPYAVKSSRLNPFLVDGGYFASSNWLSHQVFNVESPTWKKEENYLQTSKNASLLCGVSLPSRFFGKVSKGRSFGLTTPLRWNFDLNQFCVQGNFFRNGLLPCTNTSVLAMTTPNIVSHSNHTYWDQYEDIFYAVLHLHIGMGHVVVTPGEEHWQGIPLLVDRLLKVGRCEPVSSVHFPVLGSSSWVLALLGWSLVWALALFVWVKCTKGGES